MSKFPLFFRKPDKKLIFFSGEVIAVLHADKEAEHVDVMHAIQEIRSSFTVSEDPPESQTLIYKLLN